MSAAEHLWGFVFPPTVASVDAAHQVLKYDTTGAASSADWVNDLGSAAPQGKCFVTLEAVGFDAYVRFRPTSTADTTVDNGLLIKAGVPGVSFYVDPINHAYIDVIAAGAGDLKVYVSSPIGERRSIA